MYVIETLKTNYIYSSKVKIITMQLLCILQPLQEDRGRDGFCQVR